MEDMITRVADSALSIGILVSWLLFLVRQNNDLMARLDRCLGRFEKHLEEHEKID